MIRAIKAHLVKDSNEVYWNKLLMDKAETKAVEEIMLYLSDREIADLYAAISNKIPGQCKRVNENEF